MLLNAVLKGINKVQLPSNTSKTLLISLRCLSIVTLSLSASAGNTTSPITAELEAHQRIELLTQTGYEQHFKSCWRRLQRPFNPLLRCLSEQYIAGQRKGGAACGLCWVLAAGWSRSRTCASGLCALPSLQALSILPSILRTFIGTCPRLVRVVMPPPPPPPLHYPLVNKSQIWLLKNLNNLA